MTTDDKVNCFKVLLVGNSGTGKTNLLSRLTKDQFNSKCEPTSGVNCNTHDILMNDKLIKTDICDVADQEKYRSLMNWLLRDADGVLLVYDISNLATFKNVTQWLEDITKSANPKTVVKLVGNKSDLQDRRAVPTEKAEQLAIDYGLSFIETSACNANNVTEAFQNIVSEIDAAVNSVSANSADGFFSTCSYISNRVMDDNQAKHHSEGLPCKSTPEQQQPFHIVLVDLKKAANEKNPTIHCVKKSLNEDIKYVALSYRWGELPEQVVDTKVGYTAVVTSFALHDFYRLCNMMIKEIDLRHMNYVWVDAICVNQTNYEQRKATIHQMSTIYEQATYILAVPDLHLAHLKSISTANAENMEGSNIYREDIYHLIHGNTDYLARIEEGWLDKYKVPNDPDLRQLLTTYTDQFMDGFMTFREHYKYYNAETILQHIYETSTQTAAAATETYGFDNNKFYPRNATFLKEIEQLHHCKKSPCPLGFWHTQVPLLITEMMKTNAVDGRGWHRQIYERGTIIRQTLNYMADLIKDWSTRVWVISEYNIAKKKNNMKYWFIQFHWYHGDFKKGLNFFKLDFNGSSFSTAVQEIHTIPNVYCRYNDAVYIKFHYTILNQLKQQTFFETMLKSKASKNIDRFYAILPQTEYKNIIGNKAEVDSWKIDTFASVRLKLFEIMNTKDRLDLLFFSCNARNLKVGEILPTFTTSSIDWEMPMEHVDLKDIDNDPCNFDLTSTSAITLCQSNNHNGHHSKLPYLDLKPKEYFTVKYDKDQEDLELPSPYDAKINHALWNRLQPEGPYETNVIVLIPSYTQESMQLYPEYHNWRWHFIYLNGNFENNIWIMEHEYGHLAYAPDTQFWTRHTCDEHSAGFNIY